ncbi:MAG TPA: ATP-binding protein [Methylomirabilota bacterium]|jgi:PAS domain S-box-containing protein|nr:ATP-binding protein [Methylomirabilota bacterium]
MRKTAGVTKRSRSRPISNGRRPVDDSFRLLFSGNPLPMWVYDVATLRFLEVNEAAVQHYGYSRAEFLRMRIGELFTAEELPRFREVVTRVRANARPPQGPAIRRYAGSWRHRLKDGQVRDMDIAAQDLEFAGRRAGLVVATDVTELKLAQASLAKSEARLRILHEIDRGLISAEAPVAIAEAALGPLRDLLGVSRAIVNLFDLGAGEAEWLAAVGRRRSRVGPGVRFPLELMGDVEALRRGELQMIDTKALPRSAAADALLASGVFFYMVVPMIAAGELIGGLSFGGEPREFSEEQISIAREVAAQMAITITQARLYERVRRQAEELEQRVLERTRELGAAKAEADGANRAKSDFLSRMSHELRTPLNAIIGFGQLLEMRVGEPRDRESVEQILKGGRHLLNLINEILDISRIEAGRLSLSPEPVQVDEAFRRVLDLARPLAGNRGIQFDVDGAALHERYVLADSQRLQQVLLNLVSNAIKYNRDGGRVTLTCAPASPGRLRLSVADTGPGIAAELQSRLFSPFDRLGAEAAGVEGTGLGLALSKHLVEAMSGEIGLDTAHDDGSLFWVELAETTSPDRRSALVSDRRSDPAAAARRRGTILYIEDNPSNLRLVERVLAEQSSVRFIPAMQGRLGLSLAREHRPDLILLDLHLPDMTGADVLQEVQRDPELRHTPVVVLTADATSGQIKRLLAAGARAYLTKPLDVQQLLTHIDAVLAGP